MAKRQETGIGVNLMELAPDSFAPCPRCAARARIRHGEPASGGGRQTHLHICRRCRHEWEAQPVSWLLCPLHGCDAHGLDATGLGGHLLRVRSALTGEMPDAAAAGLLRKEAGLSSAACLDPELLRLIRGLWAQKGQDISATVRWLHLPNAAIGTAPAALLARQDGVGRLSHHLGLRL